MKKGERVEKERRRADGWMQRRYKGEVKRER